MPKTRHRAGARRPIAAITGNPSLRIGDNPRLLRAAVPKSGCADGNCGYVTPMNWQQVVSLLIVALAAGLLLWGRFRPRRFSFQRDTHCGCSAPRALSTQQSSIVFHARKGKRREVVVRMK